MITKIYTSSWTNEPFVEYLPEGRVFIGWSEQNFSSDMASPHRDNDDVKDNLKFVVYADEPHGTYAVNNLPNPYVKYDQSYLWGSVSQENPYWDLQDNNIFVTYASRYNMGAINVFANSIVVHEDIISASEAVRYFDYDPYFQTPKDVSADQDTVYVLFSSPHDTHYSYQGGAEVRLGSLSYDLTISENSIELSDDWNGSYQMTMSAGPKEKNIFWFCRRKNSQSSSYR